MDVFVKDRAAYSAVIFRDAVDVDVNTVAYLITTLFAQNSRFIAFEFLFVCVYAVSALNIHLKLRSEAAINERRSRGLDSVLAYEDKSTNELISVLVEVRSVTAGTR